MSARLAIVAGCLTSILGPAQSALSQSAPSPAIVVRNPAAAEFVGIVPVSIPWPRGQHRELSAVAVGGVDTACEPMIHWADGSIAVVRAWPRIALAPGATVELAVAARPGVTVEPPDASWLFEEGLPLRTVVVDPWGRRFVADFVRDSMPGGDGGFVRQRRYHARHRDGGHEFLGARAYLVTVADSNRAELTLLLDNAAADGAPALGPVRFRSFSVEVLDPSVRLHLRFADENLLEPVVEGPIELLETNAGLYLGDRTAKAFRFDVVIGDDDAVSGPGRPPVALPDAEWTRHTGAFGAHGGPAAPIGELEAGAWKIEKAWRKAGKFGPFGDFGDPADSAAQGTPRNGPCALHATLQFRSAALLAIAEAQVLQHSLRPTPGYEPRRPRAWRPYRQGISSRARQMPWGFTAIDYEHFSVDLLYDFYWLTGDAFARDEIVRVASGLRSLLDGLPFKTSRGEGWCMQAAALIRRATGDRALLTWIHERFIEQVLPEMGAAGQPFALRQPPHDLALGGGDPFDAPWQMAALVHGLRALYDETGDRRVADAALRTAELMAKTGWVADTGPKYVMSALDSTRYRMPVGFEPVDGTATFQIGAFVLAAELAERLESTVDKGLLVDRADFLMKGRPHSTGTAANRWFQIYLDRYR